MPVQGHGVVLVGRHEARRRGRPVRKRTPLQLIAAWILVLLVVVLLLAIVTGLLRIDLIP